MGYGYRLHSDSIKTPSRPSSRPHRDPIPLPCACIRESLEDRLAVCLQVCLSICLSTARSLSFFCEVPAFQLFQLGLNSTYSVLRMPRVRDSPLSTASLHTPHIHHIPHIPHISNPLDVRPTVIIWSPHFVPGRLSVLPGQTPSVPASPCSSLVLGPEVSLETLQIPDESVAPPTPRDRPQTLPDLRTLPIHSCHLCACTE